MNKYKILGPIICLLIAISCSTTKNIPDGKYLLNNMSVKTDNKVEGLDAELETFVRQDPNSSLPLLGKTRLKVYNMAGDSGKWINRMLKKIGEPPIIFSDQQTALSANQLKKEMNNLGYLNAEVDTLLNAKDKKMSVTYNIKTGTPYRIRNYTNVIQDTFMVKMLNLAPLKPLLKPGDLFNMSMLEDERIRVNTIMRNIGYYTFSKEYAYFKADTTLNSNQVDLYLDIYPAKDSLPYPRYRINDVTVISGFKVDDAPRGRYFKKADTTDYKEIKIIRGRKKFLRSSVIYRNNFLRKGMPYSDILYSKTFEAFNNNSAIRQTNITLTPSQKDSTHLLDAVITLTPADAHWFRAGVDGTNSAGDIGVAPYVTYQHQNIFNGSEQFYIRLKGAYEFISGDNNSINGNYYEYGIETGITFPQFLFPWLKRSLRELPSATTRFSIGLNNQHRKEYTRQFFNTTINYGWTTKRSRLKHSLDLMDINYVRMPSVSDDFRNKYMSDTTKFPLLRESYKNQLIARTGYSLTITSKNNFGKLAHTYTIRTGIEVAGALPRLVTSVTGKNENSEGKRQIFGVEYSEYVKGTLDYARTLNFSKSHSLAYHIGLGIAYPYGNSNVLPFERRFFGGGANSVRGWSTRDLGPGSYRSANNESDFVNQTGDIKLDMSVESRHKISSLFEIAGFVDAGNVWTIKNYKEQPDGQFEFNRFYKEIALAYGLGIRFDLGFLLLRLDTGMKAYDPEKPQSGRFVLFKPRLSRMAWHFGIGYPF